jgi:pyruvate formate lyase activating enzyme
MVKKEAMLYEKLEKRQVRCKLCSHRCTVADGKFGFCGVRKNENGALFTYVYGEAIASHVDPIEKKPLYHFLPGSQAFSIATVGCNFHCGFCQNWQISQASKKEGGDVGYELKPEEVVREAKRHRCKSISYTYTEPTIFFEYAYATAQLAKAEGLANTFVTNGYMTAEALDTIQPYLDAANVDLKSFSDEYYKKNCKGRLQPVLDSIRYMKKLGIWIEVTTLIIPGENDSDSELRDIAQFIAKTDVAIPWHISRFHPDYRFTDHRATPVETLRKARDIGKEQGLRYLYLGNILEGADTRCYQCNELLVKRSYFSPEEVNIKDGRCPSCSAAIDGRWK